MADEYHYMGDDTDTGNYVGGISPRRDIASPTSLLSKFCEIYIDALHGKFGRLISFVTIAFLATVVLLVITIFNIVQAIIPFTRQSPKEILKSSIFYLKLSAIGAGGLAVLID